MPVRLKREITEQVKKSRNDLYPLIAKALKIKITSVHTYLKRESPRLTQPKVLKIIAKFTKKKVTDLIENYDRA